MRGRVFTAAEWRCRFHFTIYLGGIYSTTTRHRQGVVVVVDAWRRTNESGVCHTRLAPTGRRLTSFAPKKRPIFRRFITSPCFSISTLRTLMYPGGTTYKHLSTQRPLPSSVFPFHFVKPFPSIMYNSTANVTLPTNETPSNREFSPRSAI